MGQRNGRERRPEVLIRRYRWSVSWTPTGSFLGVARSDVQVSSRKEDRKGSGKMSRMLCKMVRNLKSRNVDECFEL